MAFAPNPPEAAVELGDLATHLGAFAYLTVALFPAHVPGNYGRVDRLAAVALWMFAIGVLIEVGQLFIAGRSSDFGDLGVDAAGILLGCFAYEVWNTTRCRAEATPTAH